MSLPMGTKNMRINLEIEMPKQTWVTLLKPCALTQKHKNPIWPPGGYFEGDIAENQFTSIHTPIEGWAAYSKPN